MSRKFKNTNTMEEDKRIKIIESSSRTIGRSVFYSILVTLISFAPLLFLEGQERRLFAPLVWTKTFTMTGSLLVAVLVVPMLLRSWMKGRLVPESQNLLSRVLIKGYRPVLKWCQRWRKMVLTSAAIIILGSLPLVWNLGSEFMPQLDEGSLLFMPVTLPDVSNNEVKRILQVQDRIIKGFPEVDNVLGKAGRAATATDNAPVSMIETIILLKPKTAWRKGMTAEKLVAEMNEKLIIPGVTNGWTQPIINRINMLATGVRTDMGIKVFGQHADSIARIAHSIELALKNVKGLTDLYTEELKGGRYLEININREASARYNVTAEEVNMTVELALGGSPVTTTVRGRERIRIAMRMGQDFRKSVEEIKRIPLQTASFGPIPLSYIADIGYSDGASMINSENGMLRGLVLFNVRGRDMGSVIQEAQQKINNLFHTMPKGYYISWSGQYENKVRAENKLKLIIPLTLLIIAAVLYFTLRSVSGMLMVLTGIPLALVGGVYSMYFYNVHFSVAAAVGFTALFGIAVETGILMIVYLDESLQQVIDRRGDGYLSNNELKQAVFRGAVLRLRPKLMTVMADIIGLLPVIFSSGTGSEVVKPITIPFVFGLISSTLFVLIVLPVFYQTVKSIQLRKKGILISSEQ